VYDDAAKSKVQRRPCTSEHTRSHEQTDHRNRRETQQRSREMGTLQLRVPLRALPGRQTTRQKKKENQHIFPWRAQPRSKKRPNRLSQSGAGEGLNEGQNARLRAVAVLCPRQRDGKKPGVGQKGEKKSVSIGNRVEQEGQRFPTGVT